MFWVMFRYHTLPGWVAAVAVWAVGICVSRLARRGRRAGRRQPGGMRPVTDGETETQA